MLCHKIYFTFTAKIQIDYTCGRDISIFRDVTTFKTENKDFIRTVQLKSKPGVFIDIAD